MAKYIELTQGYRTLVDDEDYEELSKHKWYARLSGEDHYAARNINIDGAPATLYMHRHILGMTSGNPLRVDHINCNTLDNRRENLRPVTHAQNLQNRKGATRASKTGVRGVVFDRGKFVAYVQRGRIHRYLGRFKTLDEASQAAADARAALFTHSSEGGRDGRTA